MRWGETFCTNDDVIRDEWDIEYDLGRQKKVKTSDLFDNKQNLFQTFSEQKEKVYSFFSLLFLYFFLFSLSPSCFTFEV